MKKILYPVFALCVLSACSNTVDMTYDCNPSGATIFEEGGRRLGVCPVTVQYHPNDAQVTAGKFYTKKITAIWPDGSSVSASSLTVDMPLSRQASYTLTSTQNMPAPNMLPVETEQGLSSTSTIAPQPPPLNEAQPVILPAAGGDNSAAMEMQDVKTRDAGTQNMKVPDGAAPDPGRITGHQDQDDFDLLNKTLNCGIYDFIDAINSGCPRQEDPK